MGKKSGANAAKAANSHLLPTAEIDSSCLQSQLIPHSYRQDTARAGLVLGLGAAATSHLVAASSR